MGKVYDALRKAEQQRARHAASGGAVPAPVAPQPAPGPEPPAAEIPPASLEREPTPPAAPLLEDAPSTAAPAVPQPERRSVWSRFVERDLDAEEESASELNKRRIALLQPESYVAEQFRSLRARIDSIAAAQPIRTIALTSALPGDGKTLSSISLAVVTSMNLGRRVLLMDCDLRQPHVHRSLGLRVDAGLAEVLSGSAKLEAAILPVEGLSLDVLPVRSIPHNPSELLDSEAMKRLLEEVAGRYDRVILDLPPVLGLPDAKIVSELCDGIVFVVRADATPGEDVGAAIDVLDRRRILGIVLNGADAKSYPRYGER